MWIYVIGGINLLFLIFSLIFILPKEFYKNLPKSFESFSKIVKWNKFYLLIIICIVIFHLIEVKFIDPFFTNLVSYDYANTIYAFEDGLVNNFSKVWTPAFVYFFVIIYIGIYPFTLWFSPLYFLLSNNKNALRSLAYGLLMIYIAALPFYLFLPITNNYTYFNTQSPLETSIPSVEDFFYSTTTQNNCLPSLHTSMTILIAYTVSLTENKRLIYFSCFIMVAVIFSVIYLCIHWLSDVIAGILLSMIVIFILHRFVRDKNGV